jgi:hypothetical protein
MLVYLLKIYCWAPRISINYSNEDIANIDTVRLEEHLLQVFSAPRNIGGFSLLLELPQMMLSVAHQSKLIFILLYEFFSLQIRVLFMSFHAQKYHDSGFGPGMGGKLVKSLRQ